MFLIKLSLLRHVASPAPYWPRRVCLSVLLCLVSRPQIVTATAGLQVEIRSADATALQKVVARWSFCAEEKCDFANSSCSTNWARTTRLPGRNWTLCRTQLREKSSRLAGDVGQDFTAKLQASSGSCSDFVKRSSDKYGHCLRLHVPSLYRLRTNALQNLSRTRSGQNFCVQRLGSFLTAFLQIPTFTAKCRRGSEGEKKKSVDSERLRLQSQSCSRHVVEEALAALDGNSQLQARGRANVLNCVPCCSVSVAETGRLCTHCEGQRQDFCQHGATPRVFASCSCCGNGASFAKVLLQLRGSVAQAA